MVKPTILIVPGSFSSHGLYQNIVDKLRAKGYPAVATGLPSTQKRYPSEPATMQEDASQIRAVTEALINQGKEVVVVCHSYGGTPTTEALEGVAVKRLIYLTAVVPRIGESQLKAMNTSGGLINNAPGGYLLSDPVMVAGAIGNDFASWEEAYEYALKLPHHSAASFQDEVSKVAYKSNPVTYILAEKDLLITPDIQRRFIGVIEEAKGKKIDVINIDSGHCPTWSQPDRLVEIIVGEAEK